MLFLFLRVAAGDEHDGDVAEFLHGAQPHGQLETVELGHVDVEDDEVERNNFV